MATIRLAHAGDAEALAEIYAPFVTARATSFEEAAPSGADMRARVFETLTRMPFLVCDRDGSVLGYAYGSRHRDRASYRFSVDVGVYVHESAHRRGIGRALYTSLLGMLAWQGYCAAHAGITLPNAASVGLHEAFDFRVVGVYPKVGFKLGAWHDVGWYQRELRDRTVPPGEPRSMADLLQNPEWQAQLDAGLPLLRF